MARHIRVFNSLFIVTDWNQELLNLCLTPFAPSARISSPKKLRDIASQLSHVNYLVTSRQGRNIGINSTLRPPNTTISFYTITDPNY